MVVALDKLQGRIGGTGMMKKAIAIALIGVVAAIVGLPPVFGTLTESQFNRRIAEINANGVWSLEVTAFERGWSDTMATIDVSLSSDVIERFQPAVGVPGPTPAFAALLDSNPTVLVDVNHGPVILRGGPYVGIARVTARPDSAEPDTAALEELLGVPYLFEFNGRSGLVGGLRFVTDVPAIDYADGSSETVFSGTRIAGHLNGDELLLDFNVDSLAWSNPLVAISFDAISFDGDTRILPRQQWLGAVELSIGQLLVANRTAGSQAVFEAENVTLRSRGDRIGDGPLTTGTLTYATDSIRAGGRFQFADSEIVVGFDRLDAAAFADYLEAVASFPEREDPGADPATVLLPIIRQLLAPEPTLSIDPIGFSMDGESFRASVNVRTHPEALPDTPASATLDPAFLRTVVSLVAEAAASRTLAHRLAAEIVKSQLAADPAGGGGFPGDVDAMAEAQAELMLGAMVAQGFLVQEDDEYRVALEVENGEVRLNGTPIPFLSLP